MPKWSSLIITVLLYFIPLIIGHFITSIKRPITSYPQYCDYQPDLYQGSNQRDVLLLSADSFAPGLELAIKTLRSTGCQARIILLTSKVFQYPPRAQKELENMGIELYSNCTEKEGRTYIPHMLRFEYELKWLIEHENEIDRVFHADAYDVLFQKDPFSPQVSKDKLIFIAEPHCFHSCGWNSAWLNGCYNETISKIMMPKYIICSGSIIGGVKPYIKLLQIMTTQPEWELCYKPSIDQPILNVIVWTGIVKNSGIDYEIVGCEGDFLTMQWCMKDRHIPVNEKGQITGFAGHVPAFVHQYNRIETLTTSFYKRCKVYPLPLEYDHSA